MRLICVLAIELLARGTHCDDAAAAVRGDATSGSGERELAAAAAAVAAASWWWSAIAELAVVGVGCIMMAETASATATPTAGMATRASLTSDDGSLSIGATTTSDPGSSGVVVVIVAVVAEQDDGI